MKPNLVVSKLLLTLWVSVLFGAAQAQSISGAGSSAAAPIYQSWAREYQKSTGIKMAYETIGSSAGIKKVASKETDFGASDVAPSEAELDKQGLTIFPVAITGVVPVVNLSKIGDGQLRLTGDVLARIFLGEITQWNAPDIVALNPDVQLPSSLIKVVVRSDGSGTTYNFADYLSKVSPVWKDRNGVKTSYVWSKNFIQAKGSGGVVDAVNETPGAIGYVDFGFVKENKLNTVRLRNLSGEYLKPSTAAFRTALLGSKWASTGVFTGTLTNMTSKGSWPITMGTFVLIPKVSDKPESTLRVLKFFVWALVNGDTLVHESNFVRLPDRIQGSAYRIISSVKDEKGNIIAAKASLL